jgi:geranylgeranyl diphosphate synthase type II
MLELIDHALEKLLATPPNAPHASLFEAARYSLFSGGKRLRPLLTLTTAEAYGAPLINALHPACALELVHTYSLIHDDLPCMDDDDLRRGKPTLHKVYAEGHAVLTGDFLLTYAFQVLSESPNLSAEQRLALIQVLSQAAGPNGMIGGQVVDIASEGKTLDWKTLEFMHLGKTAALFAAAILFGGIIGNAPASDLPKLEEIGLKFGLAFQIADDLDDHAHEPHKATAITLLGPEQAQQLHQQLLTDAHTTLHSLSNLSKLIPFLARSALECCALRSPCPRACLDKGISPCL